jgi:hypothetical protein
MRITQDLLNKYARETIKRRQRSELDLHAAYLTGSILVDSPLLGGTTDIDLVLVHKFQKPVERECLPLTPEISLDILHTLREDYEQHKQLRLDPFMGYPLTHNNILLYDHEHWLEFIQSGVSANFHRPDNVLARVNALMASARDDWFSLMQNDIGTLQNWLDRYLKILSLSANAVVGLIGPPLTRRRFLLDFRTRVKDLGTPKALIGLYSLLGFNEEKTAHLSVWINAFREDFQALGATRESSVHLSPCRQRYYSDAMQALADSDDPQQAAWPLLRTWLDVYLASNMTPPNSEIWKSCLETLGFSQESAEQKIEALDAYLDSLEIIIETWTDEYGI